MDAIYDEIGRGYNGKRIPDPRIYTALRHCVGAARRLVNLGAGAGSYEPHDLDVVAVEPSATMLAQRPADAAPAVQAVVEQLPFPDDSFDLAMGVLTLHHWHDWRAGLHEAVRVSGNNVLLLTWFDQRRDFWLADYFPEIAGSDSARFPTLAEYESVLGPLDIVELPIPHDCTDGFMYAYWRRPEAYLDPGVRAAISTFSMIDNVDAGVARLAADLGSGRWREKYGELLQLDTFDHGYRLVRSRG